MRVAVIAPVKYLHKYCTTGFHLCYASIVLSNKEYQEFYRWKSQSGDTVVLDHTPSVLLKHLKLDDFITAYSLVKPTHIVLPSVNFSGEKTIDALQEYYMKFRGKCQLIGVLQGYDLLDIRQCYKRMVKLVDVIGLPVSCEKILDRSSIVSSLKIKKTTMHLEVLENPHMETPTSNSLGIATSLPLRLAYELRTLSEWRGTPKQLNFNAQSEDLPDIAETNVKEYLRLIKDRSRERDDRS